jgi:hypothetical protein
MPSAADPLKKAVSYARWRLQPVVVEKLYVWTEVRRRSKISHKVGRLRGSYFRRRERRFASLSRLGREGRPSSRENRFASD